MKSTLSALLIILVTLMSVQAYAKKRTIKKIHPVDAKELCLITHGAAISDNDLKKCIAKVLKTGKVNKTLTGQ